MNKDLSRLDRMKIEGVLGDGCPSSGGGKSSTISALTVGFTRINNANVEKRFGLFLFIIIIIFKGIEILWKSNEDCRF